MLLRCCWRLFKGGPKLPKVEESPLSASRPAKMRSRCSSDWTRAAMMSWNLSNSASASPNFLHMSCARTRTSRPDRKVVNAVPKSLSMAMALVQASWRTRLLSLTGDASQAATSRNSTQATRTVISNSSAESLSSSSSTHRLKACQAPPQRTRPR